MTTSSPRKFFFFAAGFLLLGCPFCYQFFAMNAFFETVVRNMDEKNTEIVFGEFNDENSFHMALKASSDGMVFRDGPRIPLAEIDWSKHKNGTGGLRDGNRRVIAEIYRKASSVFEYGLGESTQIADLVGVPRYTGVDSDPLWVQQARDSVLKRSSHFRFYLADIGPTRAWGFPKYPKLEKTMVWNYQLAPLVAEKEAFDVYMVDGRWRLPCVLISFLHASAHNRKDPTVLLHDCERGYYHLADHLLDLNVTRDSFKKLCIYHRKNSTTDEELLDLWLKYRNKTE